MVMCCINVYECTVHLYYICFFTRTYKQSKCTHNVYNNAIRRKTMSQDTISVYVNRCETEFIVQKLFYILNNLNRNYDVCSCISQSEDINPGVLSVKTEFMKVFERACHED